MKTNIFMKILLHSTQSTSIAIIAEILVQ